MTTSLAPGRGVVLEYSMSGNCMALYSTRIDGQAKCCKNPFYKHLKKLVLLKSPKGDYALHRASF